ncbi:MAG TPA: GNAT family acetyltransferase [Geminicoccaceae bacterium]
MSAGGPRIVVYGDRHFQGVRALWETVFPDDPPWNRAEVAIPKKLLVDRDLFLVALDGERVIGTVMAGYDGHRGWLYAVAVHPEARRTGVGRRLVEAAEDRLRGRGCIKLNLQVRAGNDAAAAFYEALGYEQEPRISLGKRL